VRAADKGSDEETLGNATTVLQAMLVSKDVPAEVLAKDMPVLPLIPQPNVADTPRLIHDLNPHAN
jgi:hypothetical protein